MSALLASLRATFIERVGASRLRAWAAYRADRRALAVALAALPGLGLLVLSGWAPTMDDADRLVSVLSRAISGLITAATIAVGFGTLALRRGIQGIGELEEHVRADERFRAEAHELTGDHALPLAIGPFLARVHEAIAREARERAQGPSPSWEGIELGAFLAVLAERSEATARALETAGAAPSRALAAALDFDHDSAAHLAHGFRLERIERLVGISRVATAYLKSLDTQWSIAQMSRWIAVSSFVAVFFCAYVALGYRDPVDLFWAAGAFSLLALPLAVFVSHVVRFVFVHQHSLPLGGFTLGPENRRLQG